MKNNKQCLNCEKEDWKITKRHCSKCYSLLLKISKLEKGLDIYNLFSSSSYSEKEKQGMISECIRQLKKRLKDMKESGVLKEHVTAHDLEIQINSTIKSFGRKGFAGRYGLGKINDYLDFNLRQDSQKPFVYQLFAKIKILNRFKIDYYKVYNTRK